jgi:hypothetical protein
MQFASEMAKRGNWREAKFRWELAAERQPENPRILNNLAVADEALGDLEAAKEAYERAAARGRGDERIQANRRRFERFWRQQRAAEEDREPGDAPANDLALAGPSPPGKGKVIKVTVPLPVPPRLDTTNLRRLLVASFLANESALLDVNRELVRFLRGEFRKNADLEVLDVTPPPAVPEQTLEDLIVNREFWTYLGREYGADLIVTGVVSYERRDSSGFRDVDTISPTTGQKVRQSQFVEQEQFLYTLDILFMDGATGELRFRDRLQRSAVFRGTRNDPITAFFELSESMAPDVLAIVKQRTRRDLRLIFRR